MRCIRIFPELCANTLCPFSNSTRNMALGSGSTTVPSSTMAASLGLGRGPSPQFRSHVLHRTTPVARGRNGVESGVAIGQDTPTGTHQGPEPANKSTAFGGDFQPDFTKALARPRI